MDAHKIYVCQNIGNDEFGNGTELQPYYTLVNGILLSENPSQLLFRKSPEERFEIPQEKELEKAESHAKIISVNHRQEFLQAVGNLIQRWSNYKSLLDETEEAKLIWHIVDSLKTKKKDPLLFESMKQLYNSQWLALRERVFDELPVTHKYLFADGSLERDIIDLIVNSELKQVHKNLIVIILADLFSFSTLKKYKETYGDDNITCWGVVTQMEREREKLIDQVRNSIPANASDFKVSAEMCKCRV